jgi:pimeloyl-ACP methyl ester carboxylesterase
MKPFDREAPMTTRRDLIAKGLAATALVASWAPAQAQPTQKTFVLVHGSWAGGWVWRRVADLLENGGHKVFTPTLTGVGERSHLVNDRVNLGTHITDIVNLIKWEQLNNFVLVGHSYGGNVITGAAEQVEPAIRSIVFLDAFVPENGPLPQAQVIIDAIRAAKAKGEGGIKPPPIGFFQNDEESNAWIGSRLTPMPIGSYTDSIVVTGARERIRKKIFVRATRYRQDPFEAAYNKVRSNPTWTTFELMCGHHAMVDVPERVTQILLDAT